MSDMKSPILFYVKTNRALSDGNYIVAPSIQQAIDFIENDNEYEGYNLTSIEVVTEYLTIVDCYEQPAK